MLVQTNDRELGIGRGGRRKVGTANNRSQVACRNLEDMRHNRQMSWGGSSYLRNEQYQIAELTLSPWLRATNPEDRLFTGV